METYAGFGKIFGSIQATGTSAKIEYRVTDGIFQTIKSQLHTLEIPLDMLNQVKLEGKYFYPKVVISAHSGSLLGDLPGSESGRVELKIERGDRELAEKVVAALGFATTPPVKVRPDAYWNPTQAVLLLIVSLINSGYMAALLAYTQQMEGPQGEVWAIIFSVMYGTVIALQLVGSVLHITNGFVFPYRAAMLTALIPNTPVFVLYAPLAIWYFIDQRVFHSKAGLKPANSKSWGETTMIFIRENRVARWFSILNIVGLVVLTLETIVYVTGSYPTSLRYRIVGAVPVDSSATEFISRRIVDHSSATLTDTSPSRIQISMWARELAAVKDSLRIAKSPVLVAIAAKSGKVPASPEEFTLHSVAEGLETSKFLTKKVSGESIGVACYPAELKLIPDLVREIGKSPNSTSFGEAIKLELTSAGRKSMTELLRGTSEEAEPIAAIGLMIDGVVQAIAEVDDQSTQRLNFVLSNPLRADKNGLSAAIRGPELPFDLELLP